VKITSQHSSMMMIWGWILLRRGATMWMWASSKDALHVLIGLITRSRAKKVKDVFNGIIQDIWTLFPTRLADLTYFLTYMWIKFIFLMCSFMLMSIIFNPTIGLDWSFMIRIQKPCFILGWNFISIGHREGLVIYNFLIIFPILFMMFYIL